MEIAQIIPHVESLIFASDHPLPPMEIMTLLNNSQGFLEDIATPDQVMSAIEAVREKYDSEFYAFEVKESGGGFQFLTKSDYFPTVAQLNGDKYLKRLSTAAMETLAIIAYKQPITKSDIEGIRGVNSDYSIQKLLEKDLIVISGRREDLVGKPLVYITSKSFMDYFGINSPDDLPKIKEILPEELVSPTLQHYVPEPEVTDVPDQGTSDEEPGTFAVSENGELLVQDDLLSADDGEGEIESGLSEEFEASDDVSHDPDQTVEDRAQGSEDPVEGELSAPLEGAEDADNASDDAAMDSYRGLEEGDAEHPGEDDAGDDEEENDDDGENDEEDDEDEEDNEDDDDENDDDEDEEDEDDEDEDEDDDDDDEEEEDSSTLN